MSKKDVNLNMLTSEDTYSLILFALYKMKELPEYSTLSELAYILDKNNLVKFLKYFGGSTITIPTMRELKLAANCLLLYQQVNIENKDFNKSIGTLNISSEYTLCEIKKMYFDLCKIMSKYDFTARSI